jgi:hypothetical protein
MKVKNRNRFLVMALLGLCLGASGAEKSPAVCAVHNGVLDKLSGGSTVVWQNKVVATDGALHFDGKESALQLRLPKTLKSATFVADLTVPDYPEKDLGGILVRPGFHNMLAVRNDGRFSFSIWGEDKKSSKAIASRTRATPGIRYRVAGVVDCGPDEKTCELTLYVNGTAEASGELPGAPFPYGKDLFVGAGNRSGKWMRPQKADIINFWVFDRALDGEEITALK